MKGANNTYFGNVTESIRTLWKGLVLAFRHLYQADERRKENAIEEDNYFTRKEGMATMMYPHEMIPVPDTGRYRLHNEIEDCIVCDKCAKICPVDCIEIEPIRSPDTFGETSDGTPKRIHAARFDIDMAKCCFCGLCTTVCPTECLTMTKAFDFSEFDVSKHTYEFAEMSEEEAEEKRKEWEEHEKNKAQKAPATASKPAAGGKPVMKPKMGKPVVKPGTGKPVMKPKMGKPVMKPKMGKPVIKPRKDKGDDTDKPDNDQKSS